MSDGEDQGSPSPEEERRRDRQDYCLGLRRIKPETRRKVQAMMDAGLGRPRFRPPFRVDIGSCSNAREDRHGDGGTYPALEDAIQTAQAVTKDSCQHAKSFLDWDCFGEFGLVFDADGLLVLDTSNEVKEIEGKAVHAVERLSAG